MLHHLDAPAAVLGQLARALTPGGGIGLMVYGRLGRTRVYEMQSLLRLLTGDAPDQERIDSARALLGDLPHRRGCERVPDLIEEAGLARDVRRCGSGERRCEVEEEGVHG